MPIGSSLGLTLPTIGQASWGGPTNTILQTIITAIEGTVSSGALLINTNLDFSSYGATNLGPVRFLNQSASLSGASNSLKLYTVSGELYFTDGSGTAIKLTDGGAVNLAGTGSITGAGYGVNDVELNWDGTYYNFKSGTSTYAPVQVDDIRLSDGSSNFVTLEAEAGMSADYTLTIPASLPASTKLVQVSSAGIMSYSNTIDNAVTLTGAVTCSSTVSCTTLSMTTGRSWYWHPHNYSEVYSSSGITASTTLGLLSFASSGTSHVYYTFPGLTGTCTSVNIPYTSSGSGALTRFRVRAHRYGTDTTLDTHDTTSLPGAAVLLISLTGLSVPASELVLFLEVIVSSGSPVVQLGGASPTYAGEHPYLSITW